MKRLLLLPLLACCATALMGQVGIGQWRGHLSYSCVDRLCLSGTTLYAAASQGLLAYDLEDNTLEALDKTHRLNDVGIATMAYDELTGNLVVAYSNANIDLLRDGRTYNLSDIKRATLAGDKSIHSIRFHQRRAYLACGFGIVVIDLDRCEIEDTWYIGPEGTHVPVYDVAFYHDSLLAALDSSLLAVSLDERYPNIASNWSLRQPLAGCRQMEVWADTLLCRLSGEVLRSMRVCQGQLVRAWPDRVEVLQADGSATTYGPLDWLTEMDAHDALLLPSGALYVAHGWAGLVAIEGGQLRSLTPSCPPSDNVYALLPQRDRLYLCQGGKSTTYANAYLPPQVAVYEGERWTRSDMAGAELFDAVSVAQDPKQSSRALVACWGYGIVELQDLAAVALYNQYNTPALPAYTSGTFESLRTGAVCFDPKGNAWMTNSLVDDGLVCLHKDGSWQTIPTRNMVGNKDIDQILYDTVNRCVWFCGQDNKLFVADAEGRTAWVDPNYGAKMETSAVTCIAQDHDGILWVGTNKGLKIITNGGQAFANGGAGEKSPVTCSNITISNDAFSEYLMAYERITALAVDGANRKWVGTAQGGLYLISANGQEELLHFTATNSPLFSNKVTALGIMPFTGEVFIGTPQGLQSYRSTATYANSYASEEVQAFPNPVEPGYDGPIAVRGFSRNALVHISDAAGHVLFSGTATGGQVVWDGRTLQGERAASGVYFVLSSDSQGKNRMVGKILVVR